MKKDEERTIHILEIFAEAQLQKGLDSCSLGLDEQYEWYDISYPLTNDGKWLENLQEYCRVAPWWRRRNRKLLA